LVDILLLHTLFHYRPQFQPERRSILFLIYHRIPQVRTAFCAS